MTSRIIAIAGLLALTLSPSILLAAETVPPPPRQSWSFAGAFGKFDRGQVQRGFKVYREVCAGCHGITLLSFRNLADAGGPGFTSAQAQALAKEYKVRGEPNDQGEVVEREGRLADRFPPAFANDQAARAANGGALPPDLSVIAKARTYERGLPWSLIDMVSLYQEHGADYIAALLTGYTDPPQGFNLPQGTYYNQYFPGHAIGMPPMLSDGQVTYTDGAPETAAQYAKDVTAFLAWAAEPHMEARKRTGFQVLVFLLVLSGLLYFTKKRVWEQIEKPREIAHGQDPTKTTI